MKTILFVADVPFKNVAYGAARHLHEIATGLSKKGYKIYVLTRKQGDEVLEEEQVKGVIVYRYSANKKSELFFFLSCIMNCMHKFKQLTGKVKFDTVVLHQPISAFVVNLALIGKCIPKVYTFYSPAFKEYETRIPPDVRKPSIFVKITSMILKWIERFSLGRVQRIIVLSEFSKNQLKEIHRIQEEDKIEIIPGGVDIERFSPAKNKSHVRKVLDFPKDKFVLLTIRNLVPRMGIENLIKAMKLIKDRRDDVLLVIGGTGMLEGKLKSLTHELGLRNVVRFEGFIPEEKLPLYYQGADIFILPTKFLEGFGLVTLEALSSGLPVLGTPVGGTNEILGKFDKNLLFKDTTPKAMAELIFEYLDHEKLNELSRRAREFVLANYSWEKSVEKVEKLLSDF